MQKIRALIVDDESPARRKISRFLTAEEDFEIVGEAGTGSEAVRLIERERPDLVFLDVQMPGLSGFGVIESLKIRPLPQVVFVTAYDQFAVKAFEFHALDYLLKPFDQPRFKKTLDHARGRIRSADKKDQAALAEKL